MGSISLVESLSHNSNGCHFLEIWIWQLCLPRDNFGALWIFCLWMPSSPHSAGELLFIGWEISQSLSSLWNIPLFFDFSTPCSFSCPLWSQSLLLTQVYLRQSHCWALSILRDGQSSLWCNGASASVISYPMWEKIKVQIELLIEKKARSHR